MWLSIHASHSVDRRAHTLNPFVWLGVRRESRSVDVKISTMLCTATRIDRIIPCCGTSDVGPDTLRLGELNVSGLAAQHIPSLRQQTVFETLLAPCRTALT